MRNRNPNEGQRSQNRGGNDNPFYESGGSDRWRQSHEAPRDEQDWRSADMGEERGWSRDREEGDDGGWREESAYGTRSPDDSRSWRTGESSERGSANLGGEYWRGRERQRQPEGYGGSRGGWPQGSQMGQGRYGGEAFGGGQRQGRGSSMARQSYAGRGPKGYTRSDDRIREDISDALMDDHDIDASEIEVDVKDGEVMLRGTVDSRDAKRLAEDLVESVSGVKNVQNSLRVQTGFGGNGESSESFGRSSSQHRTEESRTSSRSSGSGMSAAGRKRR